MKVAVFGKLITLESRPFIEKLHRDLLNIGAEIIVYKRLNRFIEEHCELGLNFKEFASHDQLLEASPDFLITMGGDGTILDAVTLIRDSGIPILGINTGRLGFLSNVSKEKITEAIQALKDTNFTIDERMVLALDTPELELEMPFALNEVTVSRKDTTAMVTVHTWINDEYLNSYWADGLIIATPTGSTGYSLSCGGPIIMPGSDSFVITPIAPHNLNVRPVVIPNKYTIKLKVEGREKQFLVSLDSRIYALDSGSELKVSLSTFRIRLIKTEIQNFAETLRNKLLWGLDRRN
ncbi:MAG: NAD kinase [Owenweeksia sp.]|nr:NAD kinase [Owenweeksia sp.]MBF99410.1 NAD kinase [Owenweeksia sp.]HCQ15419.1 NAD kinase [Cryomorphaceae bacterium]|tara:strand:+ start:446 stop:1324 length:879 start_codon:yes stop_codon:yes gene_type:complete